MNFTTRIIVRDFENLNNIISDNLKNPEIDFNFPENIKHIWNTLNYKTKCEILLHEQSKYNNKGLHIRKNPILRELLCDIKANSNFPLLNYSSFTEDLNSENNEFITLILGLVKLDNSTEFVSVCVDSLISNFREFEKVPGCMDLMMVFKLFENEKIIKSDNFLLLCDAIYSYINLLEIQDSVVNKSTCCYYLMLGTLYIYTEESWINRSEIYKILKNNILFLASSLEFPYVGKKIENKIYNILPKLSNNVSNLIAQAKINVRNTMSTPFKSLLEVNLPSHLNSYNRTYKDDFLKYIVDEDGFCADILKYLDNFVNMNKGSSDPLESLFIKQIPTHEVTSVINDNDRGESYYLSGVAQDLLKRYISFTLSNSIDMLKDKLSKNSDQERPAKTNTILDILYIVSLVSNLDKTDYQQLSLCITSLALKPEKILRYWAKNNNYEAKHSLQNSKIVSDIDINQLINITLNKAGYYKRRAILNLLLRENLKKDVEEQILTSVRGFNLRNDVAHGFKEYFDINDYYIALLACLICINIENENILL